VLNENSVLEEIIVRTEDVPFDPDVVIYHFEDFFKALTNNSTLKRFEFVCEGENVVKVKIDEIEEIYGQYLFEMIGANTSLRHLKLGVMYLDKEYLDRGKGSVEVNTPVRDNSRNPSGNFGQRTAHWLTDRTSSRQSTLQPPMA